MGPQEKPTHAGLDPQSLASEGTSGERQALADSTKTSNRPTRSLVRARLVLPVANPAIVDGAVLIAGNRILRVGRWRDFPGPDRRLTLDLGEGVLLPGLVNAHCHLDYTNLAGEFEPPKIFTDWLKLITTAKAQWTYSDYAESWLAGARMLAASGTTTVADIEAVPELLPEVWEATPLRVISFLEMTGIRSRRAPGTILQEALDQIAALPAGRSRARFSPHAPYSTLPELLRLSAREARRRRWPVTTHVAESAEEFAMFTRGRGVMFDWLERSGRDMADCGRRSPVQHLEANGLLSERLLAVHVNHLAKKDTALLAKRRVHVAHCPRSHAFFKHAPFALKRLRRAGVNVCLGTDSLASVYKPRREPIQLSLFAEMQALAASAPWLPTRRIVEMATLNGARALSMAGQIGQLSKGSFADMIALPFAGRVADIWEAVVHHSGPVTGSMIDGRWIFGPEY